MTFLLEHKKNLFDFSRSNPMMNINLNKCSQGSLELDTFYPFDIKQYQKVIRTGIKNQHSFGLNTILYSPKALKWVENEKEWLSPLYFQEVSLEKQKGSTTPVAVVEETQFFNELLVERLKTLFNISLSDPEWDGFVQRMGFEITELNVLANFDYKRYVLIRDYEAMQQTELSPILKKMASGDDTDEIGSRDNTIAPIYPLDASQIDCLEHVLTNSSLVIQGPPGTGKSRTITNIIGQNLYYQKSTLFVAEKRAALEVVDRLIEEGKLGHLSSIIHDSERDKKRFIKELSEAWEALSEDIQSESVVNFSFSSIQNDLSLLNKNLPGTNVSYQKVIDRLIASKEKSISKANMDLFFFEEWMNKKSYLQQIYSQLKLFNARNFAETPLSVIDSKILSLDHPSDKISKFIDEILATLEEIENKQLSTNFNSLHELTKASSLARILVSLKEISYENLLKSSFRKRLFTLYTKYSKYELELKQKEAFLNQWKQKWSVLEIDHAINVLNSKALKDVITVKKITQQFRKDFQQSKIEIPILDCLKEYKRLLLIAEQKEQFFLELKTEYGVNNPHSDVLYLKQLFNQIETSTSDLINTFKKERFKKTYLMVLDQLHQPIQNLHHYTNTLFGSKIDQMSSIRAACLELLSFKDLKPLITFAQEIKKELSETMYKQIVQMKGGFDEIDYNSCEAMYEQYISKDLNYTSITSASLELKFKHKTTEELQFCRFNRSAILVSRKANFDSYHELLNTPAQKLNSSEKKLKKELRKGKSILIKEFTKTRAHKSIRHLYESEARHWIKILKPVLLLSPISVSEIFPLSQSFDTIIFDEASQIPIEDSLPSLQRTKQVVVTGDSKQMTPSNLFRSNVEERFSLLEFIKYEYKNKMLNYHYRSKHQDLIEWSNQSFYNGQIQSCTQFNFRKKPIEYIELTNNDYFEGVNKTEAQEILNYIQNNKQTFLGKDCMIVTLSEGQSQYISKLLKNETTSSKVNYRVTSLEKLQGEECAIVMISLTHGPDKSGSFSLNFGPLNQHNGANRVNVLASRAKEKMVVFSSFNPSRLASENNGIRVLKNFIEYVQKSSSNHSDVIENPKLHFNDIHLSKNTIEEIYSKYKQLIRSNWTPKFHLTKDEL